MKIEDKIATFSSISDANNANSSLKTISPKSIDFSLVYNKSLEDLEKKTSTVGDTSFEDVFQKASKEHGVPVNLLKAVAKAESGFNAKAVSSCGAQGIMQLMPKTAASLGVSNSFDPEQNIMGGAKYLSQMLKNYDGNTTLALAAYNAGAGNVKKYGGVPPFKETQNYISKVMGYVGENIDVGGYGVNKSTQLKNYMGEMQSAEQILANLSQGSSSLTASSDAFMLDKIISQDKDPEEEYLTTMFLLNMMESRNKVNSIGSVAQEEKA